MISLKIALYQPSQTLLDGLQAYQFSPQVTMYFCPTCGTTILGAIARDPNKVVWGIPTGTLEEVDGVFDVKSHQHIQDTLDGGFADFLPSIAGKDVARFAGFAGKSAQLPLPWQDLPKNTGPPAAREPLYGHCHCKTLEFWISRPSELSAQATAGWPDALVPYVSTKTLPPATEAWWLRANGTKYFASLCVCTSCRLASGMEWVEWAFIPACNLWADKEMTKPLVLDQVPGLRAYESSEGVRRHFCGTCGAFAFWQSNSRPMVKDVAVGLLETKQGARAEQWLEWGCERVSFAEVGMERAPVLTSSLEHGLELYGGRASAVS